LQQASLCNLKNQHGCRGSRQPKFYISKWFVQAFENIAGRTSQEYYKENADKLKENQNIYLKEMLKRLKKKRKNIM
jgi:hypothetical protein